MAQSQTSVEKKKPPTFCFICSLHFFLSLAFSYSLSKCDPNCSSSSYFSLVSCFILCAFPFRAGQKQYKYMPDKLFARSLQLRSQPPERNMQGVAENDTVNLEGLLSHGAICHKKSLYCFHMYSVHTLP